MTQDTKIPQPVNSLDFAAARDQMAAHFAADPSGTMAYEANIAGMLHDRHGMTWETAQAMAPDVMHLMFRHPEPYPRAASLPVSRA